MSNYFNRDRPFSHYEYGSIGERYITCITYDPTIAGEDIDLIEDMSKSNIKMLIATLKDELRRRELEEHYTKQQKIGEDLAKRFAEAVSKIEEAGGSVTVSHVNG